MERPDAAAAYDAVADLYDSLFGDELDRKPRERAWLEAFAAACPAGCVVDAGCGPGHVGAHVRLAAGRRVVGVDASAAMLAIARTRLDGVALGDLRSLPLPTAAVAGVTAFYCLIHVPRPDRATAFAELARVLVPGGRLLVTVQEGGDVTRTEFHGRAVPATPVRFWQLDDLVAAAEAAGLVVERAERFDPYELEGSPNRRLVLEAVSTSRRASSGPS